ncbi:MAG: hypothetical protein M3O94_05765, partial [Actinomycetota bacterium]|nr:hypothetical protein [Actinomycetota bacterium]
MEELIERCAGIDVGQAESVVCVRVPDAATGGTAELVASYGTTTPDLLELVDWLRGLGVTHVEEASEEDEAGQSSATWPAARRCRAGTGTRGGA